MISKNPEIQNYHQNINLPLLHKLVNVSIIQQEQNIKQIFDQK